MNFVVVNSLEFVCVVSGTVGKLSWGKICI